MKIKFIGFSVTEFGNPSYPKKFSELLHAYYPASTVEYVALGGLSIDSLPYLLANKINIKGYDLIVLEIATSWWSRQNKEKTRETHDLVSRIFLELDTSESPYCFLNLYRKDLPDNDVVTHFINVEAGSSIPVIDLKQFYRHQFLNFGNDDTTDGIHPTENMINKITSTLKQGLFEETSTHLKPKLWSTWRRDRIREFQGASQLIKIGTPSEPIENFKFDNRHGMVMEGFAIRQNRLLNLTLDQSLDVTGVFFAYGPDTNYLKFRIDEKEFEVPMHDSMSFYRRIGYWSFFMPNTSTIQIWHPDDIRRAAMVKSPWEPILDFQCYFLGFSCTHQNCSSL